MLIESADEIDKRKHSEPIQENITISEEVPDKTAFEEIESPGLDFVYVDAESVQRKWKCSSTKIQEEWVQNSRWYNDNCEANPSFEQLQGRKAIPYYLFTIFERFLLGCKKPKLFAGTTREEPCNSPLYEGGGDPLVCYCPCLGGEF